MGTGNTFWGYSGWVVNLTTHFYLEMRLKMNANTLLIPLYALVIWMSNALLYCVRSTFSFVQPLQTNINYYEDRINSHSLKIIILIFIIIVIIIYDLLRRESVG